MGFVILVVVANAHSFDSLNVDVLLLLLFRLMHCASRAFTTRNEWIFGLFVDKAFCAPPIYEIRFDRGGKEQKNRRTNMDGLARVWEHMD